MPFIADRPEEAMIAAGEAQHSRAHDRAKGWFECPREQQVSPIHDLPCALELPHIRVR